MKVVSQVKNSRFNFFIVVFFIFSCSDSNEVSKKKEIRLDSYVELILGSGLEFNPTMEIKYHYNVFDELTEFSVFNFNPQTKLMEEQSFFELIYNNRKVQSIVGYLYNTKEKYIEYKYEYYQNGSVAKIIERNILNETQTQANFEYSNSILSKITYNYTNAQVLEYEIDLKNGNIIKDKVIRENMLCSKGQYSYDQHNNPFKLLGFLDYQLNNLTNNNKTNEDVNFLSCSFPSFIPESHTYTYNTQNYPVSVITKFKNNPELKLKREYHYK